MTLHILVQDEIRRGIDAEPAAEAAGAKLVRFTARDDLAALETRIGDARVMVFSSLQIASRINRRHPGLARGMLLPRAFLQHSVYTSLVPREVQLNPDGIYLPWGRIPGMIETISPLFPNGAFLRPDSPMKPFTGMDTGTGSLAELHDEISRTLRIDPEEMTYITHRQVLPEAEWRCWIVDGAVAASAGYSWTETSVPGCAAPDAVIRAGTRLAAALEMREQVFTADFVLLQDTEPRLVELNAMSTSGWYPGVDLAALFAALDPVIL